MSRIRSVHPEFFLDESIMGLCPTARLLWIGIWTYADDHGVFEWKPNYLKATVLPVDSVSIPELLRELEGADCIKRMEVHGRSYGVVRNFCLYQRPNKPVYKHPFPDWCGSYTGIDRRKARDEANRSRSSTEPLPDESGTTTSRRGEERNGREGE
jgi:hypothetical protein